MAAHDNSPPLCSNSCGFFGNPITLGLCSKCYRDHLLQKAASFTVVEKPPPVAGNNGPAKPEVEVSTLPITRCSTCQKRLKPARCYHCRCGEMLCLSHRYPDTHGCTFDYKAVGREILSKENPVVKAGKLEKMPKMI